METVEEIEAVAREVFGEGHCSYRDAFEYSHKYNSSRNDIGTLQ